MEEETVFSDEGGLAVQQCLGLRRTILCLIKNFKPKNEKNCLKY